MPNERVQFNLTERFAAPLPEFYRRRIIFWKDEDREFEKDVDELDYIHQRRRQLASGH